MQIQLMGFDPKLAVEGFLKAQPTPSTAQVASFLQLYAIPQRSVVAQMLVGGGVSVALVADAMTDIANAQKEAQKRDGEILKKALTIVSASAVALHGYRRNDSIFWAAWWFTMGMVFPLFTPIVAIGQLAVGSKK